MPMTPQPPSASAWRRRRGFEVIASRERREAIQAVMSCSRSMMTTFFSSIVQQIHAPSKLPHTLKSQTTYNITQLHLIGGIETTNALGAPIWIDQLRELRVGCGQPKRTTSPSFAIATPCAAKRNQLCRAHV